MNKRILKQAKPSRVRSKRLRNPTNWHAYEKQKAELVEREQWLPDYDEALRQLVERGQF